MRASVEDPRVHTERERRYVAREIRTTEQVLRAVTIRIGEIAPKLASGAVGGLTTPDTYAALVERQGMLLRRIGDLRARLHALPA
ncbi:hypothetical protein [Anaeromyxobacter sp. SG64]|uniref:hypothetical protein n=1 Tax=Anaeromyxobacter sp. SG64 TaxID=2925409 RepID=UPI001F578D19|nr:hypothetical protein [Anaeromyxobacter sp. SG64]